MTNGSQTDTVPILQHELSIIEKWEKKQNEQWFWEKIMSLPFALLDKVTPKFVQDYIANLLDEIGSYIQTGGSYLISEKQILRQLQTKMGTPPLTPATLAEVPQVPIHIMNQVAEDLWVTRKQMATVQGATTGVGGIFTLAIDIPTLLGLSLKVLQEMAIVYGYNPHDKRERIFIVKCLQFASAEDVGKKAVLKDLIHFHTGNKEREALSQIQGWREVIRAYRDNFGWKKLFQMIPIVGIIFGAFLNRSTIADVAEAGHMLYRKRRVLEKLEQLEQHG